MMKKAVLGLSSRTFAVASGYARIWQHRVCHSIDGPELKVAFDNLEEKEEKDEEDEECVQKWLTALAVKRVYAQVGRLKSWRYWRSTSILARIRRQRKAVTHGILPI